MQQQIEFFNYQILKKEYLKSLKQQVILLEKDIEKTKVQYQRNTKNCNFNELLIEYLKTNPLWISDYLGEYLIEVKNDKIIFTLSDTFIDENRIDSEYKYLDPYHLGYMLSDNFAGRSKYWYSEPYQSKKYKLNSWESYHIFQKIVIKLK